MDKNELFYKYELMLIVDIKLTDEQKEATFKEVKEIVEKSGAKVINSQVWLEKHKFTFDIEKCNEGTYYLINLEGKGSCVEKIRSALKLNEKILRSAVIKI